jgi:hypothetical protein
LSEGHLLSQSREPPTIDAQVLPIAKGRMLSNLFLILLVLQAVGANDLQIRVPQFSMGRRGRSIVIQELYDSGEKGFRLACY